MDEVRSLFFRFTSLAIITTFFLCLPGIPAIANELPSFDEEAKGALERISKENQDSELQKIHTQVLQNIDQALQKGIFDGKEGKKLFWQNFNQNLDQLTASLQRELEAASDVEIEKQIQTILNLASQNGANELIENWQELESGQNLTNRQKLQTLLEQNLRHEAQSAILHALATAKSIRGLLTQTRERLMEKGTIESLLNYPIPWLFWTSFAIAPPIMAGSIMVIGGFVVTQGWIVLGAGLGVLTGLLLFVAILTIKAKVFDK